MYLTVAAAGAWTNCVHVLFVSLFVCLFVVIVVHVDLTNASSDELILTQNCDRLTGACEVGNNV